MHNAGHQMNSSELTMHTFANEPIKFSAISWDQLEKLTFQVARALRQSDRSPFTRIITLAKGGWPMARTLSDFLGGVPVASIGVRSYRGIEDRQSTIEVYQELPEITESENILVFDDVADTGHSLQFVIDSLTQKGITKLTTATIFYKQHSAIIPDYYAEEASSWIIFPYELFETFRQLEARWTQKGIAENERTERFKTLGFSDEVILDARNHFFLT